MKKFFYLLAVLFTATVFTSCSDDENGGGSSETTTEAEFTICMYATGGDNLDYSIIYELLDNIDEVKSTNGKVRLVGIYKPSPKHQALLGESGGTRYFELDFNKNRTQEEITEDGKALYILGENNPNNDSIPGLMADQMLAADLVGEKYADADFKMYDPDNIATALKFLAEKAPAKQYILLTDDHGAGWTFSTDTPLTRGMVQDNDVNISLDELNAGVSKSGIKFSALFCDLCLMAHLENLYGYSESFPICIASAETTTGSKVGILAQRLAALGGNATHDQLFSECCDWVTTTDEESGYRTWETLADLKERTGLDFQDMGCYDLTKIGNLTSPLTAISKWYANAMSDSELKYIIEKSVLTTLYTTMPSLSINQSLYSQDVIKAVKNYLGNQNMTVDEIADEILKGKGTDLYNFLKNNSDKQVVNYFTLQCVMAYGFPLAYFVWNTERIAKDYKMTKVAEELDQLLSNYEEALKGMCKIKCSYDDFTGCTFDGVEYPEMDAYLWTSPTIVISSLESNSYQNTKRIDFSPWANAGLPLSDNLAAYNNTKFDQLTNWSSFLQELEVNPNVVTNFFRQVPVYYAKFGSVK